MRFAITVSALLVVLFAHLPQGSAQESTGRTFSGNALNPMYHDTGRAPPADTSRRDGSSGSRAYRGHGHSGHSHYGYGYGPRVYGYSYGGVYGTYGYHFYSTTPGYFSYRPYVYAPAYPCYYPPYGYGPVFGVPAVPVPVIPRW